MHLSEHLQSSFPEHVISHTPADGYDIYQSPQFRLIVTRVANQLRISYIRVTEQGNRIGDKIVDSFVAFCRQSRRTPYASMPEPQYRNFWWRNGFEATADDDELWIHEDWI